jgi:beta-glucosidase
MPFRVIAKMTNGMADLGMVEALLTIINGHFFRGVGSFVSATLRHRRASRALARELDATVVDASSTAHVG